MIILESSRFYTQFCVIIMLSFIYCGLFPIKTQAKPKSQDKSEIGQSWSPDNTEQLEVNGPHEIINTTATCMHTQTHNFRNSLEISASLHPSPKTSEEDNDRVFLSRAPAQIHNQHTIPIWHRAVIMRPFLDYRRIYSFIHLDVFNLQMPSSNRRSNPTQCFSGIGVNKNLNVSELLVVVFLQSIPNEQILKILIEKGRTNVYALINQKAASVPLIS